jgi:hypothetical protein
MNTRQKTIEDIVSVVGDLLPQQPGEEITRNMRAALASALDKMGLVTREEFEVQQAVLSRTREKLERLEKLVAELERELVQD